jgi:hypothetical protein
MGFGTVALVAMEPGEAHGGTQNSHILASCSWAMRRALP